MEKRNITLHLTEDEFETLLAGLKSLADSGQPHDAPMPTEEVNKLRARLEEFPDCI